MTTQIDPLILRKLDAFSQRRRKLIILRGVCAAAATLLLTMMVVALVDAIFVLPDAARWTLSGVAYLAVIVVEWRASLRLLLQTPGPRQMARLVEHAEPKLREDLLSAVELGETHAGEIADSAQFRSLVQSDVAQRMEGMDMERLLPVNLVRRYIGVGVVAAVVCIVAFVLSGMQFGTLLLRALAPGANLARVSQVKVRIVEPASPDKVVAQGETESLIIEISGRRTNAARLETITASGRDVLKMTPLGEDRFSATIQVGREDVIYRVFAGDAVTKKFRLHAVARPHVTKFTKTYTYPAYLHREPRTVEEENGDIVALEGTEVALRVEANQSVSEGELRVEQGKKSSTVKLEPDQGGFTAHLTLSASGTYRVHLVGAETGFENKFSPEYELRAEPDLVPQVDLETPKQDLILPSNEIVDITGTASDDQGLAKVTQLVKINEGSWTETVLAQSPGLQAKVARRWDLFEQGVKPGDFVTMKLAATDLKGSHSESRPVRVTIIKSGFETKRLEALDAWRTFYAAVKTLRETGEQFEKRSRETREQFERLPDGDPQRSQVAITADSASEDFAQKTTAAWAQLTATLKNAEAGHTGADLVQLGRALSRADAGFAQPAKSALDLVIASPGAIQARDLMKDFAEGGDKANGRAKKLEEWARIFLFTEEVEVIAENLNVVAQEAHRLNDLAAAAKEPAQWTQIGNRVRVIVAESRAIEEVMEIANTHGQGDRLKWARKQLEEMRNDFEKPLAGEAGDSLLTPVKNLARRSDEVLRNVLDSFRDLHQRAANENAEMIRENQPAYANFDKLREDLAKAASRKQWPEEARAALIEQRWENRKLAFKQHGDVEETRTASDSYFVNDLRTAALALDTLRIASATTTPDEHKKKLTALDKDFRLLEMGHGLSEVLDGLQHLAAAERWEIATARARTTGPREWRWLESRLRVLPEELGKIQPEEPLRTVIQQAQKILWEMQPQRPWQELNREMNDRFNTQREPVTEANDVTAVAGEVKRALDLLRAPMDEARKDVAELAPKLHEMMADLAKKTEDLKKKNEEQAQQAAEKTAEQLQTEAQRALTAQQELTERVETLKDALRADANQQDIMKAEGRERARDADDALALLKDPPPKAEQALTDATQVPDAATKAEAMKAAAQEQQKLAGALEQLAKHYENAEEGKAQETRTALRATEEQTGIKEEMDQQAAKAEEMAKMAEETPEELLKKLEQALTKSTLMQQELSIISRNTLDDAATKLAAASARENQVAQDVQKMAAEQPQPNPNDPQNAATPSAPATPAANPAADPQNAAMPPPANAPSTPAQPQQQNPALAQAAQLQQPIAEAAKSAGEDISRAGRHEQRLQNTQPGQKLEKLGEQVKETATTQVPKAEKALRESPQASQASAPVTMANEQLQKHLGEVKQAAGAPKAEAAAPKAETAAQSSQPASPEAASPQSAPSSPGQTAQQASSAQAAPAAGDSAPKTALSPASGLPPSAPGELPPMPQLPTAFGQNPTVPATPEEQMWMARTLDELDAALHTDPNASSNQQASQQPGQNAQGQQPQPAQNGQQKAAQQPGQKAGQQMSQAQQAMQNAAQATAAAMRASRAQKPSDNQGDVNDNGPEQAVSRAGTQAQGQAKAHGKLQDAKGKSGEWGKLPKQVAEQLTRGQNENVAGEYRNQVETYYKVIAEKSKKP